MAIGKVKKKSVRTNRKEIIITKDQCKRMIEIMDFNEADAFSFEYERIAEILNELSPYKNYKDQDAPKDLN